MFLKKTAAGRFSLPPPVCQVCLNPLDKNRCCSLCRFSQRLLNFAEPLFFFRGA
jgi:hypothetical protein